MKVIIICPRTPRLYYGGLENLTLKIAEKTAELGSKAEIFCTSKNPKDSKIGKINIKEFPAFSPNESYYFSLQLYNALKKSDADVIHSIGYNNLLTLLGLIAKKKSQKFVLSLNIGGEPPLFRKILHLFYNPLVNFFADRIDKVICVTQQEFELFRKKLRVPEEKFSIVQTGIDIEKIKEVKAGKKGNYIISPGRFVKIKNFHHLIPAFAIVAKKIPDIKLLLIGSGPMENQLKKQATDLGIKNRVIFEPPVPMEKMSEVHKKIKESRMVVLLTDSGYEGIMGFESIACNVPVLFADSKNITESVKKGYAQAVSNPENHEEVAEKMITILNNPEHFTPKNSKILSWAEVTEKTYNIYKDIFIENK